MKIKTENFLLTEGYFLPDSIRYEVWKNNGKEKGYFIVDSRQNKYVGPFSDWDILHNCLIANARVSDGCELGVWEDGFYSGFANYEIQDRFNFEKAEIIAWDQLPTSITLYHWTAEIVEKLNAESTSIRGLEDCLSNAIHRRGLDWTLPELHVYRLKELRNFHKKGSLLVCKNFVNKELFAVLDRQEDYRFT